MVNGISQQSPALRLPSQSDSSHNTFPLVVDGLIKRPPLQHVAELETELNTNNIFHHIILRDDDEKYVVSITVDGTIHVHDFEGNAVFVNNQGGTYLDSIENPAEDLLALTVIDKTFIVNKKMVVAAGTEREPNRPHEGCINVRAGNYEKTYEVTVNGTIVASYQTPKGDTVGQGFYVETDYIADQLYSDMDAAGYNVAPWNIARYGNVIYIRNTENDFTLDCDDGYANNAMIAIKDRVAKFSDLPSHNAQGFTVLVAGPDGAPEDDYWVKFEWTGTTGSQGIYKEAVKPFSKLGVDATTMPHELIRHTNGNFIFRAIDWENRKCGDEESVPDPSFVGSAITDIFLHRRRLGILTEDNCVLSETSKYYQFFRSTLTALLDTDPIDIAAAHIKVSRLNHAVPFQDYLVLFSDQTQFRLAGDETLTPKTVTMRPLTEMDISRIVRPVGTGPALLYVAESNSWAQMYEYYLDKGSDTAEPVSVSDHVPVFIPAPCRFLVSNSHLRTALVYSASDLRSLYVYNWYVNNREKLQSAWTKWNFPSIIRIHAMAFDKSWLTMVIRRSGTYTIERINLEQGQQENVHLDGRMLITPTYYNEALDRTYLTTPYEDVSSAKVVVAATSGSLKFGTEMANVYPTTGVISASTWYLEGDQTGKSFYLGFPYDSHHTFSEFFTREPSSNERIAITDGRLQLLSLSITYAKTSYFKVEVEYDGRPMRTYEFNGYVVGDPNAEVGTFMKTSGRFVVPLWSRSDRCRITIRNDTWKPFSLTNAQWRGIFSPHSRQK